MAEDRLDDGLARLRRELFAEYNEVVGPLLAAVEARFGKHPIELLNEARAFLDHIARSYRTDLSLNERSHTLERSRTHLVRIELDCFKVLIILARRRLRGFFDRYKTVKLGLVDSGRFLPELMERRDTAEGIVLDAKLAERNDGSAEKMRALKLWEKAYEAYGAISEFIKGKTVELAHSATHQRCRRWGDILIAALISFTMGCLSGWALKGCESIENALVEHKDEVQPPKTPPRPSGSSS